MRYFLRWILLTLTLVSSVHAQTSPAATAAPPAPKPEVQLGVGDIVKITVYQNPDLTVDSARISENGQINFPLIGNVVIGGMTMSAAEQKIAKLLRDGGFVLRPQVSIQLAQIRSSVVAIPARETNTINASTSHLRAQTTRRNCLIDMAAISARRGIP